MHAVRKAHNNLRLDWKLTSLRLTRLAFRTDNVTSFDRCENLIKVPAFVILRSNHQLDFALLSLQVNEDKLGALTTDALDTTSCSHCLILKELTRSDFFSAVDFSELVDSMSARELVGIWVPADVTLGLDEVPSVLSILGGVKFFFDHFLFALGGFGFCFGLLLLFLGFFLGLVCSKFLSLFQLATKCINWSCLGKSFNTYFFETISPVTSSRSSFGSALASSVATSGFFSGSCYSTIVCIELSEMRRGKPTCFGCPIFWFNYSDTNKLNSLFYSN